MTRGEQLTSAILLVVGSIVFPTTTVGAEAAWEYRPYRVAIVWNVAEQPPLSEPLAHDVREAVGLRLRETYGAAWEPTDDEADLHFDVGLAYEAGGYVATVREASAIGGADGTAVLRRTADRAMVADLVAAAIGEAFRPLMRIDEVRDATVRVRHRAAALYPPATLDRLTRRGAVYQPFVRRYDRDGAVLETKPIPWTFVEADEPRGGEALCIVRSGLHNPLSLRRRGRTERLAVAVPRPTTATTVRVTSRDGRPLAGCRVFVQDGDAPAVPLGETDATGRIIVPPADGRVRTLYIASRFAPLAGLPLVPGLVDELEASTAGSPELLAAEDRLAAWQAKALDLLIERRVLSALVESKLEQDDRDGATAALARLERAVKPSELSAELESLRRRLATGPETVQRPIEALFAEAAAAATMLDDAAATAELRRRATAK